jgi:hypothetical protein
MALNNTSNMIGIATNQIEMMNTSKYINNTLIVNQIMDMENKKLDLNNLTTLQTAFDNLDVKSIGFNMTNRDIYTHKVLILKEISKVQTIDGLIIQD